MTQAHSLFVCLQVSELFGGMEVCAVSVVVGKDGREHIISACDSTFALIGDSQEEDRRQIADLVSGRMQVSLLTWPALSVSVEKCHLLSFVSCRTFADPTWR